MALNHKFLLAARPVGMPKRSDWTFIEELSASRKKANCWSGSCTSRSIPPCACGSTRLVRTYRQWASEN